MSIATVATVLSKLGWLVFLLICLPGGLLLALLALVGSPVSLPFLATATALLGLAMIPLAKLGSPTARRQAGPASDPCTTLVLKNSVFSIVLSILSFWALAATCALALAAGIKSIGWQVSVWLGLAYFAVLGVVGPIRERRRTLILSPEGLDFTEFNVGPISWVDIKRVEIARVLRTNTIALYLHDEQKYVARGFKQPGRGFGWTRYLVPSQFLITDFIFDVPLGWLLSAIQVRLDHFAKANKTYVSTVQRQGITE